MARYQIVQDHPLYFVTFSVVQWLPVFIAEEACRVITDSFNFCYEHKQLRTNAFVIMPTHMHAVVFDDEHKVGRLQQTLADMRKYTGRQLAGYCTSHLPACFARTMRAEAGKDRAHRFWQRGTHPEAIYSQRFLRQKVDYIHDNPVRKGLVLEPHYWRFSSAALWLQGGNSEIVLTQVER